jgi:hypothetical protein
MLKKDEKSSIKRWNILGKILGIDFWDYGYILMMLGNILIIQSNFPTLKITITISLLTQARMKRKDRSHGKKNISQCSK